MVSRIIGSPQVQTLFCVSPSMISSHANDGYGKIKQARDSGLNFIIILFICKLFAGSWWMSNQRWTVFYGSQRTILRTVLDPEDILERLRTSRRRFV